MFEPPGSRDPFLGEEVGRGRQDGRGGWMDADFSPVFAEAGWWAWPILAIMALGTLTVVTWQHYFGGRR